MQLSGSRLAGKTSSGQNMGETPMPQQVGESGGRERAAGETTNSSARGLTFTSNVANEAGMSLKTKEKVKKLEACGGMGILPMCTGKMPVPRTPRHGNFTNEAGMSLKTKEKVKKSELRGPVGGMRILPMRTGKMPVPRVVLKAGILNLQHVTLASNQLVEHRAHDAAQEEPRNQAGDDHDGKGFLRV